MSEAVPFEVAGWIVDARGERIPLRARLRLSPEEGGQPVELALHRWHERLDVARLFHSRAYLVAGFSVQVPAGSLRPGRWKLSLLYQRKRRLRTCEDGSSVYVEAAQ